MYSTNCFPQPDPVSSTSSGTSTLTPTVEIDTSTQCQNIDTGTMCPCLSPNMKYVNLTQEVLEKILENLKKELTLNKTLLAKSLRRRISAKDSRLSSQLMGYTGAIMLATPILIIVLSDVANLIRSLSVKKRRRNGSTYPA
ncbi:hypothetical protein KP79_PYT13024 [Mizuhopecten yessoensis]|uniref:Uncharacterized protein n=1 Tax=Mizuhopecten yessoensis TaxID=6573 RepID=A0A210Q894_MIZYE|nr:hypothetical protein KP79_PYT13024 [Mizuhopecten yessoensis]